MVIKLYIDLALIKFMEREYGTAKHINELIEECGIWYTENELKKEIDDDVTLEEIISDYYFIVEDDKILFCSVEQMIDDIREVLIDENQF